MKPDWLQRLDEAYRADGRSLRAISKAAGLGVNFLSEVLAGTKVPSVENLIKVCDQLKVSITYILTGVRMDAEHEEMLEILSSLPPERREILISLVRTMKKGEQS